MVGPRQMAKGCGDGTSGPFYDAVCDFACNQVRRWAQQLVDWLLEGLRALCEELLAHIAAYQRAAAQRGADDDRLQARVVTTLGQVLTRLGARLVEQAETMTPRRRWPSSSRRLPSRRSSTSTAHGCPVPHAVPVSRPPDSDMGGRLARGCPNTRLSEIAMGERPSDMDRPARLGRKPTTRVRLEELAATAW